eukprot:sb/3479230/
MPDIGEGADMSQVLYVGKPSAKDNSGAGLATLVVKTLKSRFPGLITHGQFVGGSFGGAVINVHFAEHVAEQLGRKSEKPSDNICCPYRWNTIHSI